MPHTNKQQPDFDLHPDSNNRRESNILSRDVEDLQSGLRVDFDQKLAEIAELLARFRSLVVATSKDAANDNNKDQNSVHVDNLQTDETHGSASITPLFKSAEVESSEAMEEPTSIELPQPSEAPVEPSPYAPEPARFESGLYKLNSQLYRFRLELDQEMEFREEPLHVHFRKESELSLVLQQIREKSSEINPDNN